MSIFSEDTYEQALIALMQEMGYRYEYGPDMENHQYSNPLLDDVLGESLQRINPSLPNSAIEDAIRKLHQIEGSSLYECNFKFAQMMQYGIEVTFNDDSLQEPQGELSSPTNENEYFQREREMRILESDFDKAIKQLKEK